MITRLRSEGRRGGGRWRGEMGSLEGAPERKLLEGWEKECETPSQRQFQDFQLIATRCQVFAPFPQRPCKNFVFPALL